MYLEFLRVLEDLGVWVIVKRYYKYVVGNTILNNSVEGLWKFEGCELKIIF